MMAPTLYATIPMNTQVPATAPACSWIPAQPPAIVPVTADCATYQPIIVPEVTSPVIAQTVAPPVSGGQGKPLYHMSVTMCMEVVWHGEFDRLFHIFPELWTLAPTVSAPANESFHLFQDSAKVRFSCQNCGRAWTSMKGRVAFWFKLERETRKGEVLFKLYGQQCQRCPNADFSHAMWYPEEVIKVIENLFNRVGTVYYGFVLPPIRIDRRTGKPRAHHDSKLCQACKDGICKEGWAMN